MCKRHHTQMIICADGVMMKNAPQQWRQQRPRSPLHSTAQNPSSFSSEHDAEWPLQRNNNNQMSQKKNRALHQTNTHTAEI